jgi:hypothetical protein
LRRALRLPLLEHKASTGRRGNELVFQRRGDGLCDVDGDRRRRDGALVLVIFGVAAVPVNAATSAKVPAKLVGSWSRTVIDADWQRAGKPGGNTGHFSMNIRVGS